MADVAALQQKLVELETRRTHAWLAQDKDRIEALLDDAFVEINYLGRLGKRQILEELFPRIKLVALEPADYALVPAGDAAALLTYRCAETIEIDGRTISGTFHVGALYVRCRNGWRLRTWQITPCQE